MSEKVKLADLAKSYAQAQKILEEPGVASIRQGLKLPIQTEQDVLEATRPETDKLLNPIESQRIAFHNKKPPIDTPLGAFSKGSASSNIGSGEDLQKKIEQAPSELKETSAFLPIKNAVHNTYVPRDNDYKIIDKLKIEFISSK